ncbi:hypothetical protein GPJ56_006469 [Histomonas meleagridis]|uniref:uncharacterized protein n=1 Tax=Histomonas meleagridis TaxID=135588 RepID=UPI003559671F|nr:hypothetical protein GPJ56_006469 [Histomonas meleagridis]KAH0801415.1 hypothetical protein GO595_006010 [Histomonas meleagridis]
MQNDGQLNNFGFILNKILTTYNEGGDKFSADFVKTELNVDSIESAIDTLEKYKESYALGNFHPLAAAISEILILLYKEIGNTEKCIKYTLKCISPLYRRYITSKIEENFIQQLSNLNCEIKLEITEDSGVPFDFKLGFESPTFPPSKDSSILLKVFSNLNCNCQIKDFTVLAEHSQCGIQRLSLGNEINFTNSETNFIAKIPITIRKPGKMTIKSISFIIGQITIELTKFYLIGFPESTILPYDSECDLHIVKPDFGVVNADYPIKLLISGIPKSASSLILSVEADRTVTFIEPPKIEIKEPDSSIEHIFRARSNKKQETSVRLNWSIEADSVTSEFNETINIIFWIPFFISFKLFGEDRYPISLKTQPTLSRNHKFILVITFEYNLPSSSTITDLKALPSEGVSLDPVDFDLPLNILSSEAFTTAIFIELTDTAVDGPLGRYEITYEVEGYDEPLKYSFEMPQIKIETKFVNVSIVAPEEVEANKQSQITLKIECLNSIDADLILSESNGFSIVGEHNVELNLKEGETQNVNVTFCPNKIGTVQVPLFLVDKNKVMIWDANVNVRVIENNEQMK